jgi:hypothetical protein
MEKAFAMASLKTPSPTPMRSSSSASLDIYFASLGVEELKRN